MKDVPKKAGIWVLVGLPGADPVALSCASLIVDSVRLSCSRMPGFEVTSVEVSDRRVVVNTTIDTHTFMDHQLIDEVTHL